MLYEGTEGKVVAVSGLSAVAPVTWSSSAASFHEWRAKLVEAQGDASGTFALSTSCNALGLGLHFEHSKMLGFSKSCSRCVPHVFLQIVLLKQFAAIARRRFRKFLGVGTPPIFPGFYCRHLTGTQH
jgi:hypothetical protein